MSERERGGWRWAGGKAVTTKTEAEEARWALNNTERAAQIHFRADPDCIQIESGQPKNTSNVLFTNEIQATVGAS